MNYAIIFAGGVGQRMQNGALPKQFLEVEDKPIIIHTLEKFDKCADIDAIVALCVEGWEQYLRDLVTKFSLQKVTKILTGGTSALNSQFIGLDYVTNHLHVDKDTVVLIHDGVRPLIDAETIHANIQSARKFGSAITVVPAIETVGFSEEKGHLTKFIKRSSCVYARAPQSYLLSKINEVRKEYSQSEDEEFVDSASMMQHYGVELRTVEGSTKNIKITTPADYYIFKAILDAEKGQQIFGSGI